MQNETVIFDYQDMLPEMLIFVCCFKHYETCLCLSRFQTDVLSKVRHRLFLRNQVANVKALQRANYRK